MGQICPALELILVVCFVLRCHLLLFLSAHALGQLMVIRFGIIFKHIHSLHSLLFPFHPLHQAHFLPNFHLALLLGPPAQLLLRLQAIFDCLADERVRSGSLNVVDVETPEVVLVLCGRTGVFRVDDLLVGNGGVVADSLEMLLVGGLKKLLALGQLPELVVGFAIFERSVWYVSLLVEGIGAIVGGAVELCGHAIKLWICMYLGDNQTSAALLDSHNKINL